MNTEAKLEKVLAGTLPAHVAIIPDGNGRWAHRRDLPRVEGHKKGKERAEELIEFIADKLPIKHLTFFTFSTENWSRPDQEVEFLMALLEDFLGNKTDKLLQKNIRLKVIGKMDCLPNQTTERVKKTTDKTANKKGLQLIMALNYGGRQEILQATKRLMNQAAEGEITGDQLSESIFSSHLFTSEIPDPDLLVRTSGERRLSNFMLWQMAYTELWITNTLWPDFTSADFLQALSDFQRRERRFGRIKRD